MRSPVNLVDEEISRQINLNSIDELDGLTGLTINLEDHIPRSEFVVEGSESLDSTIDRIIQDNSHLLDAPIPTMIPTIIPDSLPADNNPVYQTPVASSSLSMSSVLRMSMRARSSAEQQARFKRPTMTPLTAQGTRMRSIEAQSPCPNTAGISSSLFDDSSSQPDTKPIARTKMPPLSLFDLSGSLPPTAQLFPPSDSGTLMDYSFKTTTGRTAGGSSRNSLLVPATQYEPRSDLAEDVVDTTKLLPTTPSNVGSSVEIPPTQFPVSRAASSQSTSQQILVGNTQQPMMSQVDLFAANLVNTQGIDESLPGTLSLTDPSIAPTFSPAIIVDQPIEPILEEVEVEDQEEELVLYSGHEMVMLPDSLGEEEDDEENSFTVKEDPVVCSDVGRISEPPVLPSQVTHETVEEFTRESSQEPIVDYVEEPMVDNAEDCTEDHTHMQPLHEEDPSQPLRVPCTGKKVKFAPTPVDSSQPPPPTTVSLYRTRTDTQEMEEAFATSLTKFCQQVITVPRSEMTPVKDVEELLMADGDIEMKPKTPLKIVSRGATPIKPFASASKTLSRILEAITPGKKVASSFVASKVSSPCPQRVVKATPVAKRSLATTPKTTKKQKLTGETQVRTKEPSLKTPKDTPMKQPKETPLKTPKETSFKTTKETPLKKTNSTPVISSSTLLGEGLLVWAHWRLQYFTAGSVEKKKSTRREVWQVRPFHRTSTTLDLSADHMLPLVLLEPGDAVLHITDRRRYKMQKLVFSRFVHGEGEDVLIEVEGGDRLELKDVIIDRTLFTAKHREWRASISAPPSIEDHMDIDVREEDDPQEDDAENREPNTRHTEPRYSLTGAGLFTGLSFILTGSNDKNKLTAAIEAAGGTIIEDLTPESLPDLRGLILISTDPQPCRTAKYYCAVLLGLERLKAGWIEASLSKGKVAPFAPYRLPPKSASNPTAKRSPLFSDTHLAFVGSKSYKTSCTQIASFTSATLVDARSLASLKERSVVVVLEGGEALTPRLQATCLANGHLIAEKAWFTDSILQGRVLPLS